MIPQNFKDILANGEKVGLYQTVAMILFILFFVGLTYFVLSRSKKYYEEDENAPLHDDSEN